MIQTILLSLESPGQIKTQNEDVTQMRLPVDEREDKRTSEDRKVFELSDDSVEAEAMDWIDVTDPGVMLDTTAAELADAKLTGDGKATEDVGLITVICE